MSSLVGLLSSLIGLPQQKNLRQKTLDWHEGERYPEPQQANILDFLLKDLKQQQGTEDYRLGYGMREDKTPKGLGYFGCLPTKMGSVLGELSIGVNIDGKEELIPSVVPTLSYEEIQHLLQGGDVTPEVVQKAYDFAVSRKKQGLPFFALPEEEGRTLLPKRLKNKKQTKDEA